VRVCEAQLIAPDNKRPPVILAVPIWKCRTVDLKREALVRLVDDVSAEMGQAASYNRHSLICGAAGTIARPETWEATRNEDYRISPVRIEHQQALGIRPVSIELAAVLLG
jgi:hypothetical protein